jgi:transposase, IS5 family
MRQKFNPQTGLFSPMMRHSIAKELQEMSKVLDDNPRLMDLVFQDMTSLSRTDTGRQGMTAEQVLQNLLPHHYMSSAITGGW